jgi:predicted membrane chloride channel (bestrophin family)
MERTRRFSRLIPPHVTLPLLLLGASSRIDGTGAFTFRTAPKFKSSRSIPVSTPEFITSRQAENVNLLEYGDDDSGDKSDPAEGWLKWMYTGSPRRTSEVAMREPAALGGLPRSDRYSSRDWLHNTISLPNSAILRDIRSPVLFMTFWATFISFIYKRLCRTNPLAAKHMCLPTTPHSLMVSALGLLLVFRTNSAYQRFAEGRKIWEDIVNSSRDLHRMMLLYDKQIGTDKRRRCQRLLAAFPYLLRHRIRPNLVMRRIDDEQYKRDPENSILLYQDAAAFDNDAEAAAVATEEEETGKSRRKQRTLYWVDKRTLPWRLLPSEALEQCARAQNRPLWVADRIATELRAVPDQNDENGPTFTARERLALISHVDKLSRCIGGCERIHQTVVPLNYARHSLRSLTLWLFTLPFALVKDTGILTGPVLFLVSWLLFGVYEIGYSIEDPFQGTLRLSIMCDSIRRDVLEDEYTRGTAFTLEPETKMQVDDEIFAGVRDSDERYEESPTMSVNPTQKIPGAKKKKEEPFFKNLMVIGS